MARTSYIQLNHEDIHFVLDQNAYLEFCSATSLKQQSTQTYPDSEPTSLCSYSLVMHVATISILQSLVDPRGARTHALLHSMEHAHNYTTMQSCVNKR